MNEVYYYELSPLTTFSLDVTKQLLGKIEAVLYIEVSGVEINLKLKNPKVPSSPSMTIKDFFSSITPKSVSSFKIIAKQYNPNTILWYIEVWKDSLVETVHCGEIEGLPKEGWKKPLS